MSTLEELDLNKGLTREGNATSYFEDEWHLLIIEAQTLTPYVDRAAVVAAIPNPLDGQKVAVRGSGAYYFDETVGGSGNWVRTSDGTTVLV